MNRRVVAWLGSFSLLIAACGGDSDVGFVPEDLADAGTVEDSGQSPRSPSSGAGEAGPLTLEADPGQA